MLRFCLCTSLQSGSTRFDLLVHIWHIVDSTAKIVYGQKKLASMSLSHVWYSWSSCGLLDCFRLHVFCFAAKMRPDPSIRRQNELFLRATFLQETVAEDLDDALEGPTLSFEQRLEAAQFLLQMDNGPWASDEIIHYCDGITCCSSAQESRMKLWVAIQEWDVENNSERFQN